jgi:hypothetical protein
MRSFRLRVLRNTYDTIYKLFQIGRNKNNFFVKVWRNILRLFAKFLVIILRTTFTRSSISQEEGTDNDIIVSMTSFPNRFKDLDLVIFTILTQTVIPAKIVVYFSSLQVDNFEGLPHNLKLIKSKILEYRFVNDDLRAHKKYFYAMQEFNSSNIVTIDDDVLYPLNLIEKFKKYSSIYPNSVICNNAILAVSSCQNPIYNEMPKIIGFSDHPNLMCIGAKSVFYPPGTLHEDFKNLEMLKYCSLSNDDLWLYAMTKLNNRRRVKVKEDLAVIPLKYKNPQNLYEVNVNQKHNDVQMRRIQEYIFTKHNFKIF